MRLEMTDVRRQRMNPAESSPPAPSVMRALTKCARAYGRSRTTADKFGDVTKNLAKGLFGALEKGAAAAKEKVDDK